MLTSDELEILRKPEMQAYIRERMGAKEFGDCFFVEDEKQVDVGPISDPNYLEYLETTGKVKAYAIPDCISRDSERPERGLIGMLDGFYSLVKLRYYGIGWRVVIQKGTSSAAWRNFDANIPRLALLKALEWQIEQEGRDERT